jgi:hypothetical protein
MPIREGFVMTLQRNSISYYFLIVICFLIVLGGIVSTLTESISSLSILLGGVGLILLILGITETNKNQSKIQISISCLLFGIAILISSYAYLQSNKFITASVFALSGILILILAAIFIGKGGE